MNEVIKEWIAKSEGDFQTAERELSVTINPNYDAVCFHAQQCIEKLMNALVIARDIVPPKTHDLAELYRVLSSSGSPWDVSMEDLHFLTRAAVEFRYPGESADREEAEGAFAICARLRNILMPSLCSMETQ
jgi:HEPN domain-containing protein